MILYKASLYKIFYYFYLSFIERNATRYFHHRFSLVGVLFLPMEGIKY